MQKLFLFILSGFSFSIMSLSASGQIAIKGIVHDEKGPLPGASIVVENTTTGTSTLQDGTFTLELYKGQFYLIVSYTGYKPRKIRVIVSKPQELDIVLEENTRELDEVVVSGQSPERNYQSIEIGVTKLNMGTLKKMPSFMGEVDIMKSLLMLPGVTSVGEGTSDINVRGGSADQNLILMDEAPIFNPSHLMGLFSIFNADVVDNIEFHRAAIPAKFGERTSSVMDISLRHPDFNKWNWKAGVGLIANRIAIDGPIIKNKLAIMLGARASYPDYIFKISGNPTLKNTRAHFTDLTAKLEYTPNTRNRFFFSTYRSNDVFKVASDSLSIIEINASSSQFSWGTQTASLGWLWAISDRLNFKLTTVQTNYLSDISSADEQNAFSLESSVMYKSAKSDFIYTLSPKQVLNFGAAGITYSIDPGNLQSGSAISNINPKKLDEMKGLETGIYLSDEYTVSPTISISGGIRYSFFQNLGPSKVFLYQEGAALSVDTITDTLFTQKGAASVNYGGVEPRLSSKFSISKTSSLKFGYNRMRQYMQRLTNSTSSLPTDRWQISSNYLKPQIVDQISLGYFRNFSQNRFETSAEVFYKSFANMTDYKDGVNFLLSSAIEADLLQGKGKSYGIETQIKKSKGNLTGWFNYTYSQTRVRINGPFEEEQINRGDWYPASYNKPHVLNLTLSYSENKRWNYGLNFTYSSGRPITYPESKYYAGNLYIPNFVVRNNSRIPDYHRLDLSMIYTPDQKMGSRFKSNWAFSIYNCYARKNAYSIFFKPNNQNRFQYSKTVNAYKLSIFGTIFPSISYNLSF